MGQNIITPAVFKNPKATGAPAKFVSISNWDGVRAALDTNGVLWGWNVAASEWEVLDCSTVQPA